MPVTAQRAWPIVGLAIVLPLIFAAFTQHAWEDYFITLRSSRNLVEGHGLVFNAGERVHTFTSPIGVLLPALCTWLAGLQREELALWLFRCINIGFLGATAWLVWRRAVSVRLGRIGKFTLFGLLLADAKLADFSINGMETAVLVFFVLLLWSELEAPAPRVTRIAVAIGGLMWTRPDAFILGGALLLPHLIIRGGESGRVRERWPHLWRGVLLGGALYVPWFAWAWWFYGTPIPHTIIAKSAYTIPLPFFDLLLLPLRTLAGQSMAVDLFMPAYWTFGNWPNQLKYFAQFVTGVAAFAWLVPGVPATARRVSLTVFLGLFYVCSIILFPWYVPPWTALAAIAVACTFDHLYSSAVAARRPALVKICRLACLFIVAIQAGMFVAVAWQMRVQQHVVENGVRRALGEWLRAHAAAGDTVFLEPLGYIGYFSNLKTYDFPGLSSPEVVAAVNSGARRYVDLIAQLKPTWLVLRPTEMAREEFLKKPVLQDYEIVKSWDAVPKLDAITFLPGRTWMEFEARYVLFRRKAAVD
jgi:hypothetical protein